MALPVPSPELSPASSFPERQPPPFHFHPPSPPLECPIRSPLPGCSGLYLLQGREKMLVFAATKVTNPPFDVIRGGGFPPAGRCGVQPRFQPKFNLLCPGSVFFDFPFRFDDAAASFCMRETGAVTAGRVANVMLTRSSSWMSLAKCQS